MMRLTALAIGFAIGGVAAAGDKPTGISHTSEAGKYSVVFPGKPSERKDGKSVATSAGNLTMVTAYHESGGVVYSVTFVDYPERFGIVSGKELLDGVVAGMKGSDGKVSASDDIGLDGVAGRQVGFTAGENTVRGKVFLDGSRLYLVLVCGKKGGTTSAAADKFLESFAWAK